VRYIYNLSISLSIYVFNSQFISVSIYLCIYLFIGDLNIPFLLLFGDSDWLGIYLSMYLCNYLSNYLSNYLTIHPYINYPSIYLSIAYDHVRDDVKLWVDRGVDAELKVIPTAGHHLYLDNSENFHSSVYTFLKDRNI
jgi:pimeloyl-ACP methyl ester carboxylesterase